MLSSKKSQFENDEHTWEKRTLRAFTVFAKQSIKRILVQQGIKRIENEEI